MTEIPGLPPHYEAEQVPFLPDAVSSYLRHLVLDHVLDANDAGDRERYEAVALTVRDLLTRRWVKTRQAHERADVKRVYYLSMEFLIGRSLACNIANLLVSPLADDAARELALDLGRILETEPDAGLGNGGLGRLAACFLDSLATLEIPAIGYGLRYEFGIFRQELKDGWQVESPDNWLRHPDPWEVARPNETRAIRFEASLRTEGNVPRISRDHGTVLLGVPYDRPVVGYGGRTINTLRLWGAATPDSFDLGEFNSGDFFGAVYERVAAEHLTRVLYPSDTTSAGRLLRFLQEYFLVACSLADIVARFRERNEDWSLLPDRVAIQLNDTHPALAVPELMRILLDDARLSWDQAWDITVRTLAYTNHTLLPEALERWTVILFELALPRQLEILYEINKRFLSEVRERFPGDTGMVERVSLFEEGRRKHVRMAHVAIVGTHSTNGVAALHSRLLKERLVPDFARLFPERFNNKTNGVAPRRWLLLANPPLARLVTESIGDGWITDLDELARLAPLADDAAFRASFRAAKREAKARFAAWLTASEGITLDPESIFDCQVKRLHEYKRQLLNILHVVVLYDRLRRGEESDAVPRTFLFAGKAAPAYALAKRVIRLITAVGARLESDPATRGRLRVVFLPNYSVSLAERLVPAADLSEQISTAGYEASGTSNMKFMMNGALTVGTRDGANIEMIEAAGEENFFVCGLSAEEVAASAGWYDPRWHYEHDAETRGALDLVFSDHFNPGEPGIFEPIRTALLVDGDRYRHLADLPSYTAAQARAGALWKDPEAWTRSAIANVAASGRFSSDRTIREYAREIWNVAPYPVP